MRFPRFRLRTLLMVVAVLALVMAVSTAIARRSVALAQLAKFHGSRAELALACRLYRDASGRTCLARVLTPRFDYHSSLRRKYEYAASRPWLPVPPDPPPPK